MGLSLGMRYCRRADTQLAVLMFGMPEIRLQPDIPL